MRNQLAPIVADSLFLGSHVDEKLWGVFCHRMAKGHTEASKGKGSHYTSHTPLFQELELVGWWKYSPRPKNRARSFL